MLTAAVTAPASTGIGGFGLSAVIAHDGGTRLAAIDGNSAAPAAMCADTLRPGPDGTLPEGIDGVSSGSTAPAGFRPVCPEYLPACNSCWTGLALVL